MQYWEYPSRASKMDEKTLRRITMDYYFDNEILYIRFFYGTLLRCLNEKEARQVLQEVHVGICATHTNRHTMARQI